METYGCRPYGEILLIHEDLFLKLDKNIADALDICSIISHDVSDNIF